MTTTTPTATGSTIRATGSGTGETGERWREVAKHQHPGPATEPSGRERSLRPGRGTHDGHRPDGQAPPPWRPPPDAAPERTAVALARWQRRRTVRALLGLSQGEVGPREGVAAAAVCGAVLGIVLQVVALTVGALP